MENTEITAKLDERIQQLETELAVSKAQLSALMDNLPFITWIKDDKGAYLHVNQSFLNEKKQKISFLSGKDSEITASIPASEEDEDREVIQNGRKMLYTVKENNRWFEIFKTPIKDKEGKTIGITGIKRDVTEIRKTTENLNVERDLLQALLDHFPYTIYFKDRDSRFIRVNKAQANLLGLESPSDAIGKTDFDFFTRAHAQDAFKDEQKIMTTGDHLIGKVERIRNCQGYFMRVSTTKIPIRDHQGNINGMVGITIDITEKYLAEQKLREARKKAIESDKLKTAFLANMSHEIRTPMNGIIGFSNLLRMNPLNREQQMEYLGIIEQCGHNLLKLIEDIIDISKIEAGQLAVCIADTPIRGIMDELFATFDRHRKDEKKDHVQLKMEIKEWYPVILKTDEYRLKQVISNLLNNALKFTDQGDITFGYCMEGPEVIFFVKDTGIGIPTDQTKVIFDRFRKIEGQEKFNRKGAGLGLAISLSIVRMLGGRMWLESQEGKGSAFYFSLPVREESGKDDKKQQSDAVNQDISWIGRKLMVVDDDEFHWKAIQNLLEPTQVELIWAKNGKEALDRYQMDAGIDLIIMDFRMPVMNGFEATRAIRSFDTEVPIIALTTESQEEENRLVMHAGSNAYLSKPLCTQQLFQLVNQYLD